MDQRKLDDELKRKACVSETKCENTRRRAKNGKMRLIQAQFGNE